MSVIASVCIIGVGVVISTERRFRMPAGDDSMSTKSDFKFLFLESPSTLLFPSVRQVGGA
jgi:hypothetical protein